MEAVTNFILLCSKITEDGNCSHEIKRFLIFEREAMTNLDLKRRDITLLTKICIVKAMVLSVVRYRCESGPQRRLNAKKLMLSNWGVEDY